MPTLNWFGKRGQLPNSLTSGVLQTLTDIKANGLYSIAEASEDKGRTWRKDIFG